MADRSIIFGYISAVLIDFPMDVKDTRFENLPDGRIGLKMRQYKPPQPKPQSFPFNVSEEEQLQQPVGSSQPWDRESSQRYQFQQQFRPINTSQSRNGGLPATLQRFGVMRHIDDEIDEDDDTVEVQSARSRSRSRAQSVERRERRGFEDRSKKSSKSDPFDEDVASNPFLLNQEFDREEPLKKTNKSETSAFSPLNGSHQDGKNSAVSSSFQSTSLFPPLNSAPQSSGIEILTNGQPKIRHVLTTSTLGKMALAQEDIDSPLFEVLLGTVVFRTFDRKYLKVVRDEKEDGKVKWVEQVVVNPPERTDDVEKEF